MREFHVRRGGDTTPLTEDRGGTGQLLQTEERWDARWLGRAAVGGGGAVGVCRQGKGLISPWLMVQIHSSPPDKRIPLGCD